MSPSPVSIVARNRSGLRRAAALLLAAACALPGAGWALDPTLPPERYTVTAWTADDGLPHSQVHNISQTDDGFLWLSTWEGTARFDGRDFRGVARLRHPDGRRLPSRLLWREADGSMLVGVEHLGLMRVPFEGEARPACERYPGLRAMRIVRGVDGIPWIAAEDALYRSQVDGSCTRIEAATLAGQEVLGFLAHADGSLWIGNRRGLYRWHDGVLEPLGAALGLPPGEVRALWQARDASVWIVGDHGVWRWDGRSLARMRSERAEAVLEDRQGVIWIAATDSLLLRYWRGQWSQLDAASGLVGYPTGALFEDREGLLWMGTTHGLFRIADGPVWDLGRQEGLPSEYVRSVLQTADGDIWIGHSRGLSRRRGGVLGQVFPVDGGGSSSVLALAPARGGGVWAGTYNRGVLRLDGGDRPAVRQLDADGPLASMQVRALLEDPDGTLWIGTERGLMAWRDGQLDPEPLPGLANLPVRALYRSPGGDLWIGLLSGVVRREAGGRLVRHAPETDYPASSAFDFLADADGAVWIASDRGLVRYRAGSFRLFGRGEGFAGSSLFRVLADDFDNLWTSGNRGVARIPRSSFAAVEQGRAPRLEMQVFGRDDGMPSRQANGGSGPAGWRMDSGQLWIPTPSGVAVFDPARVMNEYRANVPLVIDQVLVDGRLQPAARLHELPAGARLSIQYVGTSLRNPVGLVYRYRMHGFDRDWIEAGQTREAAYTNLPAGRLQFEVQVARTPADWSRPASVARFDLEVQAPWWMRAWVLGLAAAALLLVLLGLHQWLGRRQRLRARRLEWQVAQRTEELREKHRQLEDASRQREALMQQLAHQARHDALTGLPNRRASDEQLEQAIARTEVSGAPLCVAIIDLDRFKLVNDRYGHQVGDRVLAAVGGQLRASLPDVFVGRTGGEEFLAVLENTPLALARERLEEARRALAGLPAMPQTVEAPGCTASIGLAERRPGEDADAVLARADQGLYAAKRQGRDRIVVG